MGEAENYCVCRPAIIVRPYSAEDVAIVVTFAVRHGFQVTSTMVHLKIDFSLIILKQGVVRCLVAF